MSLIEVIHALLEAAVVEARTNPCMLERDGEIYWRAAEGRMVRITAGRHHLACEWTTT